MDTNKTKYALTKMGFENSKCYWRIFLCYIFSVYLVFKVSDVYYAFPLSTVLYLIIYIIFIWIMSMWITVYALQKLLKENMLMTWNFFKSNTVSDSKSGIVTNSSSNKERHSVIKLTKNIDKYFVKNWYNNISDDDTFSKESRLVLEEVIKSLIQVQYYINKSHVLYGAGNIFLKHLKEYRRTLKRKEKYDGDISELYRYSHISMSSQKAPSYFIHQMCTSLFSNYIYWELWNSLACQILISIISKKISSNLLDTYSKPAVLNYYLLKALASEKVSGELQLEKYSSVEIRSVGGADVKTDQIKENVDVNVSENVVEPLPVYDVCDIPINRIPSEFMETKDTVLVPQKESEKIRSHSPCDNNVKIHEPKSSTRIWNEAIDLDAITVGEDPLHDPQGIKSQQIDTFVKNELWGDSPDFLLEDEDISPLNTNRTLMEEVKNITSMEGIKSSIKPLSNATVNTFHNIKDFQETTVNNMVKPVSQATSTALNKIGDFQDEAAGVVEGLLDFGRAGIRKGLKLTGLQEELQTAENKRKFESLQVKNQLAKRKMKKSQEIDLNEGNNVWMNPLQSEDVLNTDSMSSSDLDEFNFKSNPQLIPSITMESSEISPDLEYEETADLATSIAKLRSLLEQKSSESSMSTPLVSPMPPDDLLSNKALLDSADLDETDGVVPSFYKFCAKTATGVFNNTLNTIKTAVNPIDTIPGNTIRSNNWMYIDTYECDSGLGARMNKLLLERKDFCVVERACEALDTKHVVDGSQQFSQIQFHDDLDDFEQKIPLAKTVIDIICELITDSNTVIKQEPLIKCVLLLFGQSTDDTILTRTETFVETLCNVTEIPETTDKEVLHVEFDVFIGYLLSSLPDIAVCLLSLDTIKDALCLLVSSLQNHKINQDILLQLFELISWQLIKESSKLTPPHSAQESSQYN